MYRIDILVQGYPGKSVCHGGLGWSTIALLRSAGRTILVDVGAFNTRPELGRQLAERDVAPAQVTDILLTHAHWDHSVNYTLFPNATIWIGRTEMDWATREPPGFNPLPELYVQDLARHPRLRLVEDGEEFLPGFRAVAAPGHTPGCLLFHMTANDVPVLFSGDAAKNRAELVSNAVDMTMDAEASRASLAKVWELWQAVPGTILIPGHDLSMQLDAEGRPQYVGQRRAGISAWFDEDLAVTREFDIGAPR
ncbi:MBL fold metallo-hydrolase [Roseomonas sp. NAR14]|uniref:MBL fold metallo-hydrolase n=1 Tax=Roseomonas acroporae TaxID=2937791 RepID=A0A9X2BVN0_9PROT|nr:MBL fold metallo-hydrolase [Roseomonas acroporae]MCK8786838.1 MBL fold metallo-hydrolase [Roseomonas acroporae]